jgi:hypothetical protein
LRRTIFLISGLALLCLVLLIKPAVVQTDQHSRLLVLWRWQSGEIRFVNSVTGKPVRIHFRIKRHFQDFFETTDETTEAYYTHGLYSINDVEAKESTDVLRFCSMKGIRLTLGGYDLVVKGDCLEVRLLWTV